MHSEGQVRHKLKQVLFRHLQKKLRLALRHRPDTCIHNQVLEGDAFRVGVCGCVENSGKVCDGRVPACMEQSQTCSWWAPVKSKDEIKSDFQNFMETSDRGLIAAEYPDVVALLWVLDGDDLTKTIQEAVMDVEGGKDE